MSNKTSHWTKEDLEAMKEQAERDRAPAFQMEITGITNRVPIAMAADPTSGLADLVAMARREAQLANRAMGIPFGETMDTAGDGWLSACLGYMARYTLETLTGGRWETGMETLARVVNTIGVIANIETPIIGIVRWGRIRLHWWPGNAPPWVTGPLVSERVRFADLLKEALRLPVEYEIGNHPQCVEHEDCAESAELGIACWFSGRNPGIPPARSSPL